MPQTHAEYRRLRGVKKQVHAHADVARDVGRPRARGQHDAREMPRRYRRLELRPGDGVVSQDHRRDAVRGGDEVVEVVRVAVVVVDEQRAVAVPRRRRERARRIRRRGRGGGRARRGI
jgi:hypothetical protein|tara:strand:+ start:234 stop:587 length:354 start_codon:yes stop_codon:yes gene_type:complete